MNPVVSHKRTKIPYKYFGEGLFKNMITGDEGKVLIDKAKSVFFMEPSLSQMCHDYPLVESLINKLGLTVAENPGSA